jgi:hypothetical protein
MNSRLILSDLPPYMHDDHIHVSDVRRIELENFCCSWEVLNKHIDSLTTDECVYIIRFELLDRRRPRREFIQRPLNRLMKLRKEAMLNNIQSLIP